MHQLQMDAILRAACRVGGRHCIPFGGLANGRSASSWMQTGADALRAASIHSRRQTALSSYAERSAESGRSRSSSGSRRSDANTWEQEPPRGRSSGSSSRGGRASGRGGYSFSERTQRAPERGYGAAEELSEGRGISGWQQREQPGSSGRGGGRGSSAWQQREQPSSSGRGGGRGAGRSGQYSQGGRSTGGRWQDRDDDTRDYARSSRGRGSGRSGGKEPRRAAPYERPAAEAYDNEADAYDDGGFSEGGGDWGAGGRGGRPEGSGYGGGSRRMQRRGADSDDGFEWPLKPSKASLREDLFGEVLYGVAPVCAALRLRRRAIHALYVQDSMDITKRKDAGAVREAVRLAGEAGAAVREIGKHELNMLTDSRPHQGLVLDCGALEWTPLELLPEPGAGPAAAPAAAPGAGSAGAAGVAGEEVAAGDGDAGPPADGEEQQVRAWGDGDSDGSEDEYGDEEVGGVSPSAAAGQHPVWLALDEVGDPQNLGAIIRSAYCLGATGILASAKNCAPLSAVVSKASAGVLETVPLHSCKNMQRTLTDAAERGWAVLGASAGRGALPLGQVAVDRPTVLVLGNEGYGLRTNVRRACTQLVRIDMGIPPSSGGMKPVVDSLNVSVAAGILLHHLIGSSRAAAPSTATAEPAAGQAANPQ